MYIKSGYAYVVRRPNSHTHRTHIHTPIQPIILQTETASVSWRCDACTVQALPREPRLLIAPNVILPTAAVTPKRRSVASSPPSPSSRFKNSYDAQNMIVADDDAKHWSRSRFLRRHIGQSRERERMVFCQTWKTISK